MKKLILILTALLLLPLSSFAQDAFYASGMLGLGQINNDSSAEYGTELTYGARGGILFNDHIALGIYFTHSSSSAANTSNSDIEMTPLLAEFTYFLNEADENGFVFSGLLGTIRHKTTVLNLTTETSGTGVGATAGYSFALSPNFTFAPQLSYIKSLGSGINNGESSMISAVANLTVWF